MEFTIAEIQSWNERIEACAREVGLDFYPTEFEICSYEEMLGYEAYIGMPSHYPHWSYGKAYERLHTLYRYNLTGLPYEMVINSNPCLAYLMRDNSLLLQILTMAHVYGHNDFFKNNRMFKDTRPELTVESFKNHANRIRNYIQDPTIGYQKVERILDAAHALRYQINRNPGTRRLSDAELKQRLLDDYQRRVKNNPKEEPDLPDLTKVPLQPEADLLLFLAEHARLEDWEQDLLMIVRAESEYFLPQIETKILNEGWASFWHYQILNQLELSPDLHFEFLKHHHQVIRPLTGGLNPYHLGFTILEYLDRNYGRDKIFEVRELECDRSFIRRYLNRELCQELNLFEYFRGHEIVVTEIADDQGWEKICQTLSQTVGSGSIPVIEVLEIRKKDNALILKHDYDGRELELGYTGETLKYLVEIWGGTVKLRTKLNGEPKTINCNQMKMLTLEDD
ncbi:MAG TPA: SpoVR family protein [Bacillota bacterium]|jgi:stage V sporulation protein R|nr:SpoVR family protein [Bacillota bacterium]HOL11076.1 SpoVR family protein [Bacillota bacterium]HPO98817.1 SpoVR family protein [Bacillota bacterium]